MHLPLLPLDLVAVHLEADALGLDDVQGLQVIAQLELLAFLLQVLRDEVWQEVVAAKRRRDARATGGHLGVLVEGGRRGVRGRRDVGVDTCSAERAGALGGLGVDRREVDVNDLLGDRVDDGHKVKRVGVEVLVRAEAGEQQGLLDALLCGEAFVVADGPAVGAELVWLDTWPPCERRGS